MKAFQLHRSIVDDYQEYLQSFININDDRIREKVETAFKEGLYLPEPLLQFNPSYKTSETLDTLEREGLLHSSLKTIFGNYRLYHHQVEAIRMGVNEKSFVVTSGTGSGKSLTFLATIFNHVLRNQLSNGIVAILVYPMNALINSQEEEIKKYEINFLKSLLPVGHGLEFSNKSNDEIIRELKTKTRSSFPITYGRYTGQEDAVQRDKIKDLKPNIILTNYMMLELMMTRSSESWLRDSLRDNLRYLVFDELHTYRGRQGADVSLLIRRIHNHCKNKLISIGTSATMASDGSPTERKQTVAAVATEIFSTPITCDQVIGETLAFSTIQEQSLPTNEILKQAIYTPTEVFGSEQEFLIHPLAVWLERKIALKELETGIIERGNPRSLNSIVKSLSEEIGIEFHRCESALLKLLQWAEELNIQGTSLISRKSYLPFKIHQFISQSGNVYVTLEPPERRYVTLTTDRYYMRDGKEIPLYPTLFSRFSGEAFVCVRKDFEASRLIPRNPDDLPLRITRDDLVGNKELGVPKRKLVEEDFLEGYILFDTGDEPTWTLSDYALLPDSWLKTSGQIDNFYEYRIPKRIYFDEVGNFSNENVYSYSGWFIAAKLLLDPTSGTIYDLRTSENTKLMRLGNEGRSTATTILSYSVLKSLYEQDYSPQYRKLLSFTDNRQDASLQSGHFNDFLMLGRLRSAIFQALRDASNRQLTIDYIADAVFKKLKLREDEYARIPSKDPDWPDLENEKAIKDFILVRILYDLKRGWRFNTPNLEQCGLLQITYTRLDEFCSLDKFFDEIPLLNEATIEVRIERLTQILNFFRTSYAFEYYKLIDQISETQERIRTRLDENKLWSLDLEERIDLPFTMVAKNVGDVRGRLFTASIGSSSNLGKYIKRSYQEIGLIPPKGEELAQIIEKYCKLLEKGNFLRSVTVKGKKGETTGYRLRIDQVVWKLGDGTTTVPDKVRTPSFKAVSQQPNKYFQQFYSQDFTRFTKSLIGREHTGQVNNQDRIEREEGFRKGEISALFCSPTMELGIDIAQLNVVHMRNVPPNPSNYAQRSGRAGRSGQTALVFTYCSNGSPHDRNYFAESKKMVAGVVNPPKIDLTNEELLLSHFNAFFLMELGLKDLHTSVSDVIDVSSLPLLPIKPAALLHINDQIADFGQQWISSFKNIALSITELKNCRWFNDEWLTKNMQSFSVRFNNSFDRWRTLYKLSESMVQNARSIMDDPTLTNDNPKKIEARREEAIGKRQRDLLLNNDRKSFGSESEFYVFRYLAAEGFLPGYNFTRLPIRSFLGHRHLDKGEFVSRPRFIALKEFGPNNLIYHNGGKYRITRMLSSQIESMRQSVKISKQTGYAFLNTEAQGVTKDPLTGQELKGQENVEYINNLLELTETDAKPQARISCEEEERTSTGFEIDQYFSFPKDHKPTGEVTLLDGDQPLLHIMYGQSARLIQINKKWRASKDEEGFAIGRVSGKWKKVKELEVPNPDDPAINVKIYTHDTADILYIQPIRELHLTEGGVITLSYALKRSIEKKFQAEEGEIGVWVMGEGEHRNILLYEAAEGSLGILSQIIEQADVLRDVFLRAYELIHYDIKTKQDTRPDTPKASYDNLLSYYNQRHHEHIDRHSIKEALERLIECRVDNQQGGRTLAEQYKYLIDNYDLNSATELPFVKYLFENGYALPDKTQYNIPGYFVSADFVYKTPSGYSFIFCDGSVHDSPEQKEIDHEKRQKLRDAGYDVVEWYYKESLSSLVERRRDLFRKVR